MSNLIQSVRGMNDCLPDQADTWQGFEAIVRDWLRRYGYREIRTPILEQTGLFKRAIGEVTDIVEKEMYTFVDELNGESLALRPEGTASSVRAVIQHNLLYDGGKRLWYAGPMFRHERPQKGRYRQFHQVGVEALGFAGPDVDAELIVMCADLWRSLGIAPTLQLNTLGDTASRHRHRARLIAHFEAHLDALDEDARRRLHSNPLRILDSKNPAMQALIEAAPKLMDELESEAIAHFESLQANDFPGTPLVKQATVENPTLAEASLAALKVLSQDSDGFFVAIEQGDIDWANHGNDFQRMVGTTKDLNDAVQTIIDFVNQPDDGIDWSNTLLIVTSDHSNSYMRNQEVLGAGDLPQQSKTSPPSYPDGEVTYGSTNHTNELVRLYAMGTGIQKFSRYEGKWYRGTRILDNTQLFHMMMEAAGEPMPSPLKLKQAMGMK